MKRKPNVIIDGEIARIELTQGKWAIVDAEDLERLPLLNELWYASHERTTFYAKRHQPGTSSKLYMHWLLMGKYVDHINHDGLDNRKQNLRFATQSQQNMNHRRRTDNKSGSKGVSELGESNKSINRYMASIWLGKNIYLGTFQTKEEAAAAYDKAAVELFGEFAFLNFPNPSPLVPVT